MKHNDRRQKKIWNESLKIFYRSRRNEIRWIDWKISQPSYYLNATLAIKRLSIFHETFTFYDSSKSFDLSESENIRAEDEGSIKWIRE